MNIELIIKLLRSENLDDVQLGYEYLYKLCGGVRSKMNDLLEETNLRIQLGPMLFTTTAGGGHRVKKLKGI